MNAPSKLKEMLVGWVREHGGEGMDMVVERNKMQILDPTGHTEISWNPSNDDEIEVAKETFERMTARGYQAFRPGEQKGQRGGRITEFDPTVARMILFPHLQGG